MVGGTVFQSVASNSVSLEIRGQRSGAIADPVVQHWIRNKEEGPSQRCRRATLTSCSWTREETLGSGRDKEASGPRIWEVRVVWVEMWQAQRDGASAGVVGRASSGG
jgi:hypothetical protein